METNRSGREEELGAVEAQIRKAQVSLDRCFHAFEEGRLREEVCTRRIEELSAERTSLEARRSDLAEELSGSQPSVPDPSELAELVGGIERAPSDGALPERIIVSGNRHLLRPGPWERIRIVGLSEFAGKVRSPEGAWPDAL